MKKKHGMIAAICILVLTGCGPAAQLVTSWRDPDVTIDSRNLNKFLVAALLKDQSVRRTVEDQMASIVKDKAVQSYKEFGTGALDPDNASYNQQLKNEGFDGVVVMSLVNVKNSTHYVPGNGPVYYRTWPGYWGASWNTFYDPGYYTTDKTYKVEVNVYSLKSGSLVWTGTTKTVDPSGSTGLFNGVSATVYKQMKKEGFLK